MGRKNGKPFLLLNSYLIIVFLFSGSYSGRAEKTPEIELIAEEEAIAAITHLKYTSVALEWMPVKAVVSATCHA